MTRPRTSVLLLTAVLLAAAAILYVLEAGPFAPAPPEAALEGASKEIAGPGGVRLAGSAAARRTAPIEDLVRSVDLREAGNEEVAAELRRRIATDEDVLARLLALLREHRNALLGRGIAPAQVFEALRLIGRPAAEGLARAWLDPEVLLGGEALYVLQSLGPDAAPALPIVFRAIESGEWALDAHVLTLLARVGEGAGDSVPMLTELVRPPVNDELAKQAGTALLAVAGPTPEVIAVFRQALVDEETLARPDLLYALGNQGGDAIASLVPLFVSLLEDPEEGTRTWAAYALGRSGVASNEVVQALALRLVTGTRGERSQAATALLGLGDAGRRALVEITRSAEDVRDRLAAIQTLIQNGDDAREHVDVLLGILDEDVERYWKVRALNALAAMDPPPDAADVLSHLEHALADSRLQQAALAALARLPGPGPRQLMLGFARDAKHPKQGLMAIRALVSHQLLEPEAGPLLVALLDRAEDVDTQHIALSSFAALRPPVPASVALPTLERLYRAGNRQVVLALPQALASLVGDDEAVVTLLLEGLRGDDWWVARSFAGCLEKYPSQASRSVPALLEVGVAAANRGAESYFFIFHVFQKLRPHWPGSGAALEQAIQAANDRARPILEGYR